MEEKLNTYQRIQDLFATIDEAINYVTDKTQEGNFEICLRLLADIGTAVTEINNSLEYLIAEMGVDTLGQRSQSVHLLSELERLMQAYETENMDILNLMVQESVNPTIQIWRKNIVETIGPTLAS